MPPRERPRLKVSARTASISERRATSAPTKPASNLARSKGKRAKRKKMTIETN